MKNETTKIENIRKATVNDRKVKMFDLRELIDGAWVFQGTFSTPQRTANKDLLSHVE